eukprot:5192-Heterococcus_DN1.PRE.5
MPANVSYALDSLHTLYDAVTGSRDNHSRMLAVVVTANVSMRCTACTDCYILTSRQVTVRTERNNIRHAQDDSETDTLLH